MGTDRASVAYTPRCRLTELPPEFADTRVGPPPLIDNFLELFFRDRVGFIHSLHGDHSAAVSTGELSNLPALAKMGVFPVLDDRDAIHS